MKCKQCNKEIDKTKLSKYATGSFCSKKCARIGSTKFDNKKETKISKCVWCGKEIKINKRATTKSCKCEECKNICKHCGQSPCKRPDVCKKYKIFPTLIKYFGFDESKIGTIEIYEEFDRVKNMLIEDYGDNELSIPDMTEKYNHKNIRNFYKILKSLDIDNRSMSESQINYIKINGVNESIHNYRYKYGWHKTGNGKDVFYRSSYELEYAKQLDEQQVNYDMENLRILYGDSQKHMQRVAIPDFYLSESNTIVEIKSDGTYDKQNMKDKIKVYKEHGYNYNLILEKKEVSLK